MERPYRRSLAARLPHPRRPSVHRARLRGPPAGRHHSAPVRSQPRRRFSHDNHATSGWIYVYVRRHACAGAGSAVMAPAWFVGPRHPRRWIQTASPPSIRTALDIACPDSPRCARRGSPAVHRSCAATHACWHCRLCRRPREESTRQPTPKFELGQPADDESREELTFPQTANVVDGDDIYLIDLPRDGVGMRDDALGKARRHCLGHA